LINIGGIECDDQKSSRVRVGFNLPDDVADLINGAAVSCFPGSPLFSINGAQITLFISPLVPDADLIVL